MLPERRRRGYGRHGASAFGIGLLEIVCGSRATAGGDRSVYAGREKASPRGISLIAKREVKNLPGGSGRRQAIRSVHGKYLAGRSGRRWYQIRSVQRSAVTLVISKLYAGRRGMLRFRTDDPGCRRDNGRGREQTGRANVGGEPDVFENARQHEKFILIVKAKT